MSAPSPLLAIVTGAAPPATRIAVLIERAQARGWRTALTLTPTAARWLAADLAALGELTGFPVRSDFRTPDEDSGIPPVDAVLACPATFNMVNKAAAGISDTLAGSIVNEAIGGGLPVVVLPHFDTRLAAHPALGRSVASLREWGVSVLLGAGGFEPHPPKQGRVDAYPWDAALAALPAIQSGRADPP